MTVVNHDLRCNDGATIYHMPEKAGSNGQASLQRPEVYEESSSALYPIGTKFVEGERVFHYAYSGNALPNCLRAVTGYVARTRSAQDSYDAEQAIGTQDLIMNAYSSSSPVENGYAGSYLLIFVGATYRPTMMCRANTAPAYTAAYDTQYSITCRLDRPVPIAIPANTDIDVFPSRYADVRKAIADNTGDMYPTLGVHLIPITANRYFWLQTWGPCFINCYNVELGDDAYNRTTVFQNDGSIRGCAEVWGAGTPYAHQFAGYTLATNGAGSEWIMLMLDR